MSTRTKKHCQIIPKLNFQIYFLDLNMKSIFYVSNQTENELPQKYLKSKKIEGIEYAGESFGSAITK